jgi:dTDP-4-dehydrorhamnose reductase
MTRVLILGGTGMLGHKLCQTLGSQFDVFATFRSAAPSLPAVFARVTPLENVDVTRAAQVRSIISDTHPDVVVNAVGIIKQVAEAKDPIPSIAVNSLLPHQLAALAAANGAKLIHVSTDCVFSGSRGAYRENDVPDPVDLYGRSKLLGEVDSPCLTLRTSIIGRELRTRVGLLEWFLAQAGRSVRGFNGAIYSGLTTAALADVFSNLIHRDVPLSGLWHVSSEPITKYQLLVMINEAFDANIRIEQDEEFQCDRSLESARFWQEVNLPRPTWTEMIRALAKDTTPYDDLQRAAHKD